MNNSPWKKDSRPAEHFKRFHHHNRNHTPYLQTVVMLLLLPLVAVISRLRVRVVGKPPKGAYIAVANHPSSFDPAFVAIALQRRIHFMGKSDLFKGIFGKLLTRLGAFPVRRGVWDQDAFETAQTALENGKVMAMFIEGGVSPIPHTPQERLNLIHRFVDRRKADNERANHMQYRPAKSGVGYLAHRTGVPIVPIHIAGTRALLRPWTWVRVTVTVGKPVYVDRLEVADREQELATSQMLLERIVELSEV